MTNDHNKSSWSRHPDHRRSMPSEMGEAMLEGTVTIGFADLEDSTGLVRRIGDVAFASLIHELDATSRELARPRRGHIPRPEGDCWDVVFGAARPGRRSAGELQPADALPGTNTRCNPGIST